jgi:hypothetical protein
MPATREDLMVVLTDGAQGGTFPLDPVRLMKACFVTSMAGRDEWRELFNFRAYDYGPFDAGVYAARDELIGRGLLERTRTGRYDSYSLTEEGHRRIGEIEAELDESDAQWLRRVGAWVASKSFNKLLDEIYSRWPEYASQSLHRPA